MKKLYNLEAAEVSLVDKGANKKKFIIFKSGEGNGMSKQNTEKLTIPQKVAAGIEAVVKSFSTKHKVSKMGDLTKPKEAADGCEGGEASPMSDRAQAALKAVGRILHPHKDEIKHEHLAAVAQEVGIGAHHEGEAQGAAGEGDEGEVRMEMAIPQKVEEEHHVAALGSAQKAYKESLSKMGYEKYQSKQIAQKSDDDKGDKMAEKSEVTKAADGSEKIDLSAFDEKQRPQLEVIFKANKDLVKKNEDLEKQIKDMKDGASDKEIVRKAESYTHLGLAKEEVIETLRDAHKLGDKSYERVCKNFDTLNEQAKSSKLFTEIGSSQGAGANDAEKRIDAAVDAIVQKSGTGKTRAQIYDEFMQTEEGKRLYNEASASYFKPAGGR